VRVYFTLGRSPVEANSVVVTLYSRREQAMRERKSELRLVNSL